MRLMEMDGCSVSGVELVGHSFFFKHDSRLRRGLIFVSGSCQKRLVKALPANISLSLLTKSKIPSATPWRRQDLVWSVWNLDNKKDHLLELLLKKKKPWWSLLRAIHDSLFLSSYSCWKMLHDEIMRCQLTQVRRAFKSSVIDRRDRTSCRSSSGRRSNRHSVDSLPRSFLTALSISVSLSWDWDGTTSVRSNILFLPCWTSLVPPWQ